MYPNAAFSYHSVPNLRVYSSDTVYSAITQHVPRDREFYGTLYTWHRPEQTVRNGRQTRW